MRVAGGVVDHLLIVEEEQGLAAFVLDLLREAGVPVDGSRVSCLAEAVQVIQDGAAAAVLLVLDPAVGGLDALQVILGAQPAVAVVVLTGPGDDALGMQAVAAGAQDFLVRGEVSADLLLRTLRHAVERADAAHVATHLAAIVESSDAAILTGSLDGTIRTWNRAAESLFGYEASEIVGRSITILEPPDRRGELDGIRAWVTAGQRLQHFVTRRMRKDGSQVDVSLQIAPLIEGGRVVGISAIARDISSDKMTEAALKESADRLAEAQRLAHIGSWSLDAATERRSWSDELYRLLGCEPGEFEPDIERFFERLHPADAVRVRDAFREQLLRSEPWEDEFRIVLPDAGLRWLAACTEPVLSTTGDVVGVHGTAQDITERRRTEERLRFQAHLLDAVGEAIIATDLSGAIIYWGPGAERLYGWAAEEVQGRPIVEVVPVLDEGHDRAEVRSLLARGEPWAGVMRRGRRDGSTFVAELSTTPVFDDQGQLVGNISVCSDVSAREEANAALEQARDHALAASVLKSNFLATMSHEIRTPMNGVLGMTDLLLDTPLDDRQREYAETVRASGDALLAILNDILDLSKIEAGRLDLESVDFDVTAVIEDVAELFAVQAHAKGLELVISIGDEVPPALRGDPGRFRQVITNLLSNAIKFTSTGLVMVSARAEASNGRGTTLRLQVDDTGIGIPARTASRVFEPFAQADSTTTREYGGTGLGLAIVRQLVELMGGRCGVDSQVGSGSSFWCTLSLDAARGGAAARPPSTEGPLVGSGVLVVDDNRANRSALAQYLTAWGVDVTVADSGPAGIDAANRAAATGRPFSLALIDMHMPVMNGIEVAEALAANPATTAASRVLLISSDEDGEAGHVDRAGIAAQLTKPVRRDRLRRCLTDLVTAGPVRTAPPVPEPHGGAGLILLAEDNPINQQVTAAMLQHGGYRVDVVVNGVEAVSAVRAVRYDLVLMDCHMPQMDGLAATAAIRAEEGDGRRVPIVALTASAMLEDKERCVAVGMDDHLAKPIRKSDLLDAVARWAGIASPAVGGAGAPVSLG